jgi:hypothetical protein
MNHWGRWGRSKKGGEHDLIADGGSLLRRHSRFRVGHLATLGNRGENGREGLSSRVLRRLAAGPDLARLGLRRSGACRASGARRLAAFLFVAIGIATPSPTAVGGEAALREGVRASGILRITRHPFLWGVTIWAVAHLLVSAKPASLIFFGSLLLLALVGPPSIDAKRARMFGEHWTSFAESTSSVPFLAISQGRNRLSLAEIGWWRVALALVLYAVFLGAHAWLFGVSPFGA